MRELTKTRKAAQSPNLRPLPANQSRRSESIHCTPDPKAFSTLQARAALIGVALEAIRNDEECWSFIVTLEAITQELRTLAEVESWLDSLRSSGRY